MIDEVRKAIAALSAEVDLLWGKLDKARTTIADLGQEVTRQAANNSALYQELFEEKSPEGQIYSAALTRAHATIAELRKGIEQIALDLSSASVTDSFYNAISQINDIEHTARALLAKGGNKVPCVCNGDRDFNISAYRHEKDNDDDQT